MQLRAASVTKKYDNSHYYLDDNSILEGAMSNSDNARHHIFNRSFDTASHTTSESPDHVPRRNVRFVNERREFDPRYDPRRPETFHLYYQPRRDSSDDERRSSPDQFDSQLQAIRNRSTHQDMRPNQHAYNPQILYSINRTAPIDQGPFPSSNQTRPIPVAKSYPREESNRNSWGKGALFQPEDFRLDRPFDESSNSHRGSTTEIDSLDEIMEQDSITTATETTGEGRFVNVLSVIEEHPSLEEGSMSYSFTQSRVQGMKNRELDGEKEMMPSFSQSPLEAREQHQDRGFEHEPQQVNTFESSPGRKFGTPESARRIKVDGNLMSTTPAKSQSPSQQKERYPMPMHTWGLSTPTSGVTQSARMMVTPELRSTTSASLPSPSRAAQQEAERLIQSFNASRRMKDKDLGTKTAKETSPIPIAPATSASTTEESHTLHEQEQDLTLHDLCGESSSVDDVAWRNALHVLSIQPHLASVLDAAGWTPLHVACLGSTPPPVFMTRALLYAYREAARKVDGGGRLPLHLVAASSGDAETMDLLVQEYPQAVYQTDYQGWTPLHLLLKNFSVDLHLNHCRILLGLVTTRGETNEPTASKILQRRGEHLSLPVEDLGKLIQRRNPVTRFVQENMHESAFEECPQDVQTSLRRLCQWKRKQRRKNAQCDDDNLVELDLVPLDAETNPAAHFTPVKRQLPLHIVVRRGLSPNSGNREHDLKDGGDDEGCGIDREEPTMSTGLAPRFIDLVRLFIAFYPEGLVACDYNGQTPLLAALSLSSSQPSLELVDLLLGKRTPGYNSLPSWAQSISFFDMNANRYLNPAMVPCKKSHQLPLHIVAEEMANDHSMISAVYSCYPGAIQCQDARGRTPLHILLGNYRRSKVDLRNIALLLSDSVAQTLDDQGKLPFDLLVEKAQYIPFEQPQFQKTAGASSESDVLNFKTFFQRTIMASSGPNVRNRFDANRFLWQLHSLPPWLRRYACSATFVQELIIEELATPFKCALILLYAALLCTLIASFRIRVQNFIDRPDSKTYTSTELTLYTSATALLVFQLIFWSLCTSMSEFLHFCVFNFWRWVDLSAIILACVGAMLMDNASLADEVILATATAATGMLYLSVVGYLGNWWYGASVFLAYVEKVCNECVLFWVNFFHSLIFSQSCSRWQS
jgi:ankyrin repeat protein